jgi:hypothetical protein
MNRFIRFNKYYRIAITCIATAITATIGVIAAALTLNSPSAITTLFFIPSAIFVIAILGINFWYKAENRHIGLFSWEKPQTYRYRRRLFNRF